MKNDRTEKLKEVLQWARTEDGKQAILDAFENAKENRKKTNVAMPNK